MMYAPPKSAATARAAISPATGFLAEIIRRSERPGLAPALWGWLLLLCCSCIALAWLLVR